MRVYLFQISMLDELMLSVFQRDINLIEPMKIMLLKVIKLARHISVYV